MRVRLKLYIVVMTLLLISIAFGLLEHPQLTHASDIGSAPQDEVQQVVATATRTRTPTNTRTPTPINVGNFVWDDIDQDGRQDAGEPGMSGVNVQLWNSAKNDLIDTAVTNASGIYSLQAPTPGNYRVRVLLRVQWMHSPVRMKQAVMTNWTVTLTRPVQTLGSSIFIFLGQA